MLPTFVIALREALDKRDRTLGDTIQSRFEAADKSLAPYPPRNRLFPRTIG